jgi:hypothetical protein
LIERVRLCPVAWEAVEDRAILRVGLIESVEQHPDRDVVRHQLAAFHEPARLEADRRPVAHRGPEEVTGGDVRDPEPLGKERGLRPLACSWRSEENHYRHPIAGRTAAVT